jgi:prepilin-type N-terminal cleavage/methylation domain-containing protein
MTIDRHRNPTGRSGFTLIEATLAMVLLGMAAAGVLLPFAGGATVQADGFHRTTAAILANDQIERIVSSPYADVLTTYNTTEAQGQVKDASGTVFTDSMYANFSRQTVCEEAPVSPQSVATNFILATVTVSYRGQTLATVRRLISQ